MIEDYFTGAVITHQARSGTFDDFGKPVFSAGKTLTGRLRWKQSLIRGSEGQQLASEAILYLEPTDVANPGDLFVVDGVAFQSLKVDRPADFDTAFQRVFLGARSN